VKTVLLRRREKRRELGLQVSPYLLSVPHTGRFTLWSRVWVLIEILRSRQRKKLLFSYSLCLSPSSIAGVEVKGAVR